MFLYKKTKIIATIGPSSEKAEILEKLIKGGIDGARLNFSHGSHQEQGARIKLIRKLEKKLDRHIAIIADMQGPKIRVGKLPEEGIELKNGQEVTLDTNQNEYKNNIIPLPSSIVREGTKEGHIIFLDDGVLQLRVTKKIGSILKAEVLKGGILFPKKGVNVPSLEIKTSILSSKDKADIKFAVSAGVDYIALSFIRTAEDVKIAKRLLKESRTKVIAKIERPEALKNLNEITDESDAVMVARGDLGIETPLWELPLRQKEIVEQVRSRMKPVIIATQMLDSMIRNPLPTRAEVSDVANAVFDSADAVMLSGESASGKYPVEAVEMMKKILETTEHSQSYAHGLYGNLNNPTLMSVAHSATYVATEIRARVLFAGTLTGTTVRAVSYFRPEVPIIGITEREKTARELALVWGVIPIVKSNKKIKTVDVLLNYAINNLKEKGILKTGDKIVCLFGGKLGVVGQTNMVTVKSVA